ncbi:MAG: recombination mediator RecR [Coprobacillus sp.]|nr:recombination mediator RecR [Coprobacillus sp.]
MKYPKSLQDLIESFKLLPGVGPKTAERFAFYTVLKMNKEDVTNFSNNLQAAYKSIKKCKVCGNLTENEICDVCLDQARVPTIMVVESSKEVNVFEKTNEYKGRYHVLNGLISPMNGIGPEDINIKSLFDRIENEKINKVIIATSANIPGEMTAMYIKSSLEGKNVETYRIGYGLPAGGDIEYADEITLIRALEGIKKI